MAKHQDLCSGGTGKIEYAKPPKNLSTMQLVKLSSIRLRCYFYPPTSCTINQLSTVNSCNTENILHSGRGLEAHTLNCPWLSTRLRPVLLSTPPLVQYFPYCTRKWDVTVRACAQSANLTLNLQVYSEYLVA